MSITQNVVKVTLIDTDMSIAIVRYKQRIYVIPVEDLLYYSGITYVELSQLNQYTYKIVPLDYEY